MECVVAIHQSRLISKIPHILKEMYDADLLEEEVILSWAEKVGTLEFYIVFPLTKGLINSGTMQF